MTTGVAITLQPVAKLRAEKMSKVQPQQQTIVITQGTVELEMITIGIPKTGYKSKDM